MRTSYSSLAMIAVLRCEVLLVGGGGVRRSGGQGWCCLRSWRGRQDVLVNAGEW